jgi:hypothetical protein
MTASRFPLTSDQNAAIIALIAVQKIEENNNFANGDLWNIIQGEIDAIHAQAEYNYKNESHAEYCKRHNISL